MSRKADAKRVRRNKRRAKRDAKWVPDSVLAEISDNVDTAGYLETFHELVTQRGWTYDDDNSTDDNVAWFYEPSVGDGDGKFTTIWITADDDAEFVYLCLTDMTEGYRFEPEALLDHFDAIEAYRAGDPPPAFD